MRKITLLSALLILWIAAFAQEEKRLVKLNIPYYSNEIMESDSYVREKCLMDLYLPMGVENFPTVVWFHGGGLTGGDKDHSSLPTKIVSEGIGLISVNYRLYPKVKCPVYLQDAAAAVSWVYKNIEAYDGNSKLIFISGISAGAYLTSMLGLDKQWLAAKNIDANSLAGLIPYSGNGITHQAIRDEKGISKMTPWVDEFAPLFHVRPDAPPLILMTGDREQEYIGRYEENAYLRRMMKLAGHQETILYEFDGYGHDMVYPGTPMLIRHVKLITEKIKTAEKNNN